MNNLNFLFAAYSVIWGILFVYLVSLSRQNRNLAREIEEVREMLQQRQR